MKADNFIIIFSMIFAALFVYFWSKWGEKWWKDLKEEVDIDNELVKGGLEQKKNGLV